MSKVIWPMAASLAHTRLCSCIDLGSGTYLDLIGGQPVKVPGVCLLSLYGTLTAHPYLHSRDQCFKTKSTEFRSRDQDHSLKHYKTGTWSLFLKGTLTVHLYLHSAPCAQYTNTQTMSYKRHMKESTACTHCIQAMKPTNGE